MKDQHLILLSGISLFLHVVVFCLPLAGIAARPAVAAVTAVTAIGVLIIIATAVRAFDPGITALFIGELLALGMASAALFSISRAATWGLGIATSAHLLMLVALLAFLLFFRMTRLW